MGLPILISIFSLLLFHISGSPIPPPSQATVADYTTPPPQDADTQNYDSQKGKTRIIVLAVICGVIAAILALALIVFLIIYLRKTQWRRQKQIRAQQLEHEKQDFPHGKHLDDSSDWASERSSEVGVHTEPAMPAPSHATSDQDHGDGPDVLPMTAQRATGTRSPSPSPQPSLWERRIGDETGQ
jgi:hypothetical protein